MVHNSGFCQGYIVSDATEGKGLLCKGSLKAGDGCQVLWGTHNNVYNHFSRAKVES